MAVKVLGKGGRKINIVILINSVGHHACTYMEIGFLQVSGTRLERAKSIGYTLNCHVYMHAYNIIYNQSTKNC